MVSLQKGRISAAEKSRNYQDLKLYNFEKRTNKLHMVDQI